MAKPMIALDVAPLAERHHTGIANVTKELARQLLDDATVDHRFFTGRAAVGADVVREILDLQSGNILHWISGRDDLGTPDFGDLDRPVIGVFCHHKRHRRLFPTEVLIVHDLTTTVTPQFHTESSVLFGARQTLADMITSDLLVAVSRATEVDIRTYFPQVTHVPSIVMHLASSLVDRRAATSNWTGTPFVLILGTLEPRKNVGFVFDFIVNHRARLGFDCQFVFVGRLGWGVSIDEARQTWRLDPLIDDGTIYFTDFVADDVRDALLEAALCVVYASKYEGFGIPVIEALALGTPVVTGYGSSLPEVGGELAEYCDVTSASSLGDALLAATGKRSDEHRLGRKAWAAGFSWKQAYERLRDGAIAEACRAEADF